MYLFLSGLTLRSFWQRRAQFEQLMRSNSAMSPSRYLRLMSLALVDIFFTIPLGIYVIYIGNKGVTLSPWISWSDTHFNFGRVIQVPGAVWRSDPYFRTSVELTRWLPVACAILFFGLFGFALEAQKQYSTTFWWIANSFGFKKTSPSTALKGSSHGYVLLLSLQSLVFYMACLQMEEISEFAFTWSSPCPFSPFTFLQETTRPLLPIK